MQSDFDDPTFLTGVVNPDAKPRVDDSTRTTGQLARDVAIDMAAKPVVSTARAIVGAARDYEPEIRGAAGSVLDAAGFPETARDVREPTPFIADTHKALGRAEKYLEEERSPRAKALDLRSPFDEKYWEEPVTSTLHHALGLPAMIGLTRGAGALTQLGKIPAVGGALRGTAELGAFGGIGLGSARDRLREFSDTASLEDLHKSDEFNNLWREFNGNESVVREQLYRKMLDPVAQLASFGTNALTLGALKGLGPFSGLIGRAVFGTVEGGLTGGAGGAASSYSQQKGQIRAGMQSELDFEKMAEEAKRGTALAGPVAAMHIFGGGKKPETSAVLPGGQDPAITKTLDEQLNQDQTAPAPSPPPTTPTLPGGAPSAPGGAPPGAPPPAGGPAAPPAGAPAPPPGGVPPGAPPAGGVATAPAGPPTALNVAPPPTAAPPPVQPTVTVTPPTRKPRAKPVTPAPTGVTPGVTPEVTPAGVPPAGRVEPTAAAPAAAPPAAKSSGIDWLDSQADAALLKANSLGLIQRVGELSKTMTAEEVVKELGGALDKMEVRIVRHELGIEPLGDVGIGPTGGGRAAPAAPAAAAPAAEPPRPKQVMDMATYLGKNADGLPVWERPDGTRQMQRSDGVVATEIVLQPREGGAKVGDYVDKVGQNRRAEFLVAGETAPAAAAPAAPVAPGSKGKPKVKAVAEKKAEAAVGPTEEQKTNALKTAQSLKPGDVIVDEFGDRLTITWATKTGVGVTNKDGKNGALKHTEIAAEFMPMPYTNTAGERKLSTPSTIERAAAPAATPAPAPVKKGEARIKAVAEKKAAREAVNARTKTLQEDLATAPEGELKQALRAVASKRSDIDELQSAADWGRANNRPDIVSAAADKADALAAAAVKREPVASMKGKKREEAVARLSVQGALARERAAEVRTGQRRPKAPEPPAATPAQEPVQKVTEAPDAGTGELKVTAGVTAPPAAAPEKPKKPAKPPRVDPSKKANSLQRGDVVTLAGGQKFIVTDRNDRSKYPRDPLITIRYEGVYNMEEHRASLMDEDMAVRHIERAPEEVLTTKGRKRVAAEERLYEPGTPVDPDGRKPPPDFPNHLYIGKNSEGHDLWEDPKTGTRVARRVGEVMVNGKPQERLISNIEDPHVAKAEGERGRYVRDKKFLVPGESERPMPPKIHRVWAEVDEHGDFIRPETHERQKSAHEKQATKSRQDIADEDAYADAQVRAAAAAHMATRNAAEAQAAAQRKAAAVPRSGKLLTGLERVLNKEINALRRGATQTKWVELRGRAVAADIARSDAGLQPVFVDKLNNIMGVGGGRRTWFKDAERTKPEADIEQTFLADVRALAARGRNRADPITVDEFNKQREALVERAKLLDTIRQLEGEEPIYEKNLPRIKVDEKLTDEQLAEKYLNVVNRLRFTPVKQFLNHPSVHKYLDQVHKINEYRIHHNMMERQTFPGDPNDAPQTPLLHIPDWVSKKIEAYRPAGFIQTSLEAAAARAMGAAKTFYNAHVKTRAAHNIAAGKVDVIDKHSRSKKAKRDVSDIERQSFELETDVEMAQPIMTQELRDKIALRLANLGARGDLNKYIAAAMKHMEEEQSGAYHAEAVRSTKDRQRANRDGTIDFSLTRTLIDHFSGKDNKFDQAALDKFLDDLLGSHDVVKSERMVYNPDTRENEYKIVEVARSLTKPTPPDILVKGPRPAEKGGEVSEAQKKKYEDARKDFEDRLEKWQAATGRQFAATDQLRKLVRAILSRYEVETKRFKAEHPKAEWGSVKWELPSGVKNTTPYMRFSAGSNDKRFQNYNFAIDLKKLLNHLEVDLHFLTSDARFKGDMAGWDLSTAPYTQYARRLTPLLQEFSFNVRNALAGNLGAIDAARAERVADQYARRRQKRISKTGDDGKPEIVDADTLPGATSITHDEAPTGEDAMIEAIDKKIAAQKAFHERQADRAKIEAGTVKQDNDKPVVGPPKGRAPARFDEGGLPTEGKRYVEGEPYVEDEVDAAHRALQTGDPTHPLIEPAITSARSLDVIKEMIQRGEGVEDLSKAITPEFLDQLGRLNEGTRVVHAPYDVVSKAGLDEPAYYNADHDVVVLPSDVADQVYVPTTIHENVHAFFTGLLQRDQVFSRDINDLLERARDYARKSGLVPKDYNFETRFSPTEGAMIEPRQLYGLRDANEMISESKSWQSFRQFLTRVPSGRETIGDKIKNVLNSLYAVIQKAARKAMGKENGDTALDVLFADQSSVLGYLDRFTSRAMNSAERMGATKYQDNTGSMRLPAPDPRDYVHPAKGTRYVERDLKSNLRRYTTDTLERTADRAAQVKEVNRGTGLSLHTAFDMEQRTGDQGFKDRMHNLNVLRAEQATETRRIMEQDDGPVIERLHNFLQGLSPGWKDKVRHAFTEFNYHRAFPDAPLGERAPVDPKAKPGTKGKLIGKNAHIDPDDLGNYQTVREHQYMQNLWNEIAKVPGLRKIAEDTWGFYKNRQPQMRSNFIRMMAGLDDLMPKGLSARDHEVTLDALEKQITGAKAQATLTPAEKTALGKIDLENEKIAERIKDIREASREFTAIAGPYLPMVREGDYAVYGRFHMPDVADMARVPATDRRTGEPRDNGIRVFPDRKKAEAYVDKITKEMGITQTNGGEWFYDKATGERAMRYTPDELKAVNEKLAPGDDKIVNRRATKADLEEMRDEGRPIESRFWVEFSPQVLEKYDSLHDARKSVANWRGRFKDDRLSITPPEQSHRSIGTHSDQHVSDVMQKIINRFRQGPTYSALDKYERAGALEELRYLSAQAVMQRGVRQRYQPRGYVLGASNDMVRSLSDYSGATAGWLSKSKFLPRITEAWNDLNNYVESRRYEHGDRDSYARTAIRDAMGERLHKQAEPLVDNLWNRTVDRLVRWTMIDKLPGISYFTANLTESGLLGIPLQVGRHSLGDVLAAHRYAHSIAGPLKMLGQGLSDTGRALMGKKVGRNFQQDFLGRVMKDKYGPGIINLINFMSRTGLYDQHSGLEYQQMARRADSGVMGAVDKTADYITNVFQAANSTIENFTRVVMGISSYKLERDRLGDVPDAHEKALRYAWDIVNRTSGVYANHNAPMAFQKGPISRLIFEFKKYPQRIISNHINAAMGGLKLFDPAVRADPVKFAEAKEKARQFGAMLVMQGMAAGALGLPTEVFSVPLNAMYIAGLTDYDWEDAKIGFRKWAYKQAGATGGDMLSYGVLRGTGIDIQPKISQSDMVFFGSPQTTKALDLRGPVLGILGGAGGGELADLVSAAQKLAKAHQAYADGNFTLAQKYSWEAARLGIPVRGISDMIDARMMGTEAGRETPSGRPRGEPLSAAEQFIKAAGFNTVRVSKEQERGRMLDRLNTVYKAQRARFTEEFTTGNFADEQRVWSKVQEWNKTQPEDRKLSYGVLIKAKETRLKNMQQTKEQSGVALDRRGRSFLPELQGVFD